MTATGGGDGRARVVLADDKDDIRALMRILLERSGFEVVGEAADGHEAIDVTARTQPDLVLLDLAMPTLDGLEALPRIREGAADTKVVVLSGFQAAQVGDQARRSGAHAYIEKGTPASEMLETLREVLGGRTTEAPVVTPPPPQEQVVSALIHELSAPVTVIEGFVELIDLPREDVDEETYTRAVGAIRRNASHLRGLLSAFADARRIDVDALDLKCEATDVATLVIETAESLRGLIAPHPLHVELAPAIPVIEIDPLRVRQAVINLVQNAAKFSQATAPVEIAVGVADDVVRIAVTDHGSGVSVEDRERLFGKFTRLRADTPGTGLGLYISRGIARAHRGDIAVESSGPEGSRFVLTLPVGSHA